MSETEEASLKARLAKAVTSQAAEQIAWLRKLASFPSTRGNEASCQDWLAGQFAARGWNVDRYTLDQVEMASLPGYSPAVEVDYRNAVQVVATVPATNKSGRSLILQGHIDVVPPGPLELWAHAPFEPQVGGGFMTGRGVYDMKAGVAEMVFALDALKAAGLKPAADVFVETVSEEECTGNGALSTLVRGYIADAVLIPESMNGQLLRSQLGSMWFRVKVSGRAAHVLETELGENAILRTYDYISALEKLAAAMSAGAASDPWFGRMQNPVKVSVGKIKGGDWIGMVPSWCEIDCRIGVLPGQDLAALRQTVLQTLADKARALNAASTPTVEWIGFQAEGFVLQPGSRAEAVLAEAHEAVIGEPLKTLNQPATSDVRLYGLYYDIPALCYGGKGSGLHGKDERVDLNSMLETTMVIALFIAAWCGVNPLESA